MRGGQIDRLFEVLDHARPASRLAPTTLALRAAVAGMRRPEGGPQVLHQMISFARDDARNRRVLKNTRSIYNATLAPTATPAPASP